VLNDPVNLVDPLGLIQDDSIIVTAPRLTDIGTVIFRAWAWRRSRFFDFDIGEAGTRGHAFQTKNQVCARSLTSREMSDLLSKFAVPGHAGQSLTAGTYFVSARFGLPGPGGRTLPGGFVRTTFERGGLRVINIALDLHVFGGQVQRDILVQNGRTAIITRGTGTAQIDNLIGWDPVGRLRDAINEKAGPTIFNALDAGAAAYAASHFKGC
jgi:hypothetical protein